MSKKHRRPRPPQKAKKRSGRKPPQVDRPRLRLISGGAQVTHQGRVTVSPPPPTLSYWEYDPWEAGAEQREKTDQRVRDALAALGREPRGRDVSFRRIQAWLRARDGYGVHQRAIQRVKEELGDAPLYPAVRAWTSEYRVESALYDLGRDASYSDIQAWIRERYGQGVSNRVIARVKRSPRWWDEPESVRTVPGHRSR